jgi:cytoskeletal protein CcmA (bactofilin family)
MFSKKKEQPELETIIGPDTIFQGTIKTKGMLRVDGRIEGGILEAHTVIIGTQGQVQGDINAKSVTVGGKVTGNITTEESLEILSKAQVFGDIHSALLSIGEGAIFEGHCVMSAENNKIIEMDVDSRHK